MGAGPIYKRKSIETEITNAVRDMLGKLGFFVFKHWSGPMSRKGVSDLLGCNPFQGGRMFAIEMKRPGWKPPKKTTKAYKHYKEQYDFLKEVERAGGIAFFAQSVDDVIDGLEIRDRFLF